MSSSALDRLRILVGDESTSAVGAGAQPLEPEASAFNLSNEHGPKMHPNGVAPRKATSQDGDSSTGISDIALADTLNRRLQANSCDQHVQGELGDLGEYCPILAVSKFPYKFMNPASSASERVSKSFFAGNRFWRNDWNLYYVQIPPYLSAKPLILVSRVEVESLFSIIANQLGLRLNLPSPSTGFVISFGGDGSPRPRYLGMSTCRDDYSRLEGETPTAQLDFQIKSDGSILASCSQRTFEEWAAKIERAIDATRNKNRASKEKRKQQRIATKIDWSRQLRRTQRYLGLRASAHSFTSTSETTPCDNENRHAGRPPSSSSDAAIDVTRPVSSPFESNVVFFCIDVEVYERGHNQVTEVGLAILNTAELVNVPPGEDGHAWMELVKARHFWIKENAHLVNSEYVVGCPDRFEASFGVTEVVTAAQTTEILKQCFQKPALANTIGRKGEAGQSSDDSTSTGEQTNSAEGDINVDNDKTAVPHRVVVVGHNINSDIDYLKFISFDLVAAPNVLEILDTSELYRTMKHEENAPSVSTMLYNFGISGWNLHNAGNDATYTLQALVGIAVRSASGGCANVTDPVELIAKAKQDAEEHVRDRLEEWNFASDGENADGGSPKDPASRVTPKKERKARVTAQEAA